MQFPTLKTGAVLQYPSHKVYRQSAAVYRFLDGAEQRIREQPSPLRRWVVQLDLMDDTEARSLEDFFASGEGRLGSFLFTDPWDGSSYPNCSIEGDALEFRWSGEGRVSTSLTIRQNRV